VFYVQKWTVVCRVSEPSQRREYYCHLLKAHDIGATHDDELMVAPGCICPSEIEDLLSAAMDVRR
jgi:hypothetical protein